MFSKRYYFSVLLLIANVGFSQPTIWSWAKGFGGPNGDYLACMASDKNGNLIVAGSSSSPSLAIGSITIAGTNSYGGTAFLAKLDPTGNAVWAQTFKKTNNFQINSVVADANGDIVICGNLLDTVTIGTTTLIHTVTNPLLQGYPLITSVFLAKFDNSGNSLWAKIIGLSSGYNVPHIAVDHLNNILYADDEIKVVGLYDVVDDAIIAKYTPIGALMWKNTFGSVYADEAGDVAVAASGDVYITGVALGPTLSIGTGTFQISGYGIFLAKFASSGSLIWAKVIDGGLSEFPRALHVDATGNVLLGGEFQSSKFIIDSIVLKNNDTIFTETNFFLAKFNSAGNVQWARTADGKNSETLTDLTTDVSGNVYAVGEFRDSIWAIGNLGLTSGRYGGIFFSKFTAAGTPVYLEAIGGSNHEWLPTISDGSNGEFFVAGRFRSNDLVIGNHPIPLYPTINHDDFFIAKLNYMIVGTKEIEPQDGIEIFPNPVTAELFVKSDKEFRNVTFSLYNSNGSLLHQTNQITGNLFSYVIPDLSPGLYLVQLKQGGSVMKTKKIVISR